MSNYLGLDPSTKSTGWAVINKKKDLLGYGKIEGKADDPKSLVDMHKELNKVIIDYNIKYILIEDTFFSKNIDTLKKLVRPTGVVLYLIGVYDLSHEFIAPASWRKITFGNGHISKKNTYELMSEKYDLELQSFNKDNDITDAIGISLACLDKFQ